ncbi:FRRS1 [Branchiostoma lanceolatum]|uniref:FRRS1 protein n=1 Tax=Branchiostoma lanceolatum TaxID=7740 RepID=A0A8K0ENF8_BRALA|nr:FRRS1 [Branchiostoma lanceolatum]
MAFSLAVAAALAVALSVSVVEGYPTGAPVSACTEMFPNHRMNHENASLPDVRYSSQNLSTAPYRITADVQGNGKVKVSLRVTNESKYWEGFFLQARVQGTTTPVGMWEGLPTNAQTRDCPSGTKTAVTHKSETKTTTLEVTWTPPAAPATMIVVFRGTFVKEFEDFWVGLESDALAVNAYVSASVRLKCLTTVVMGTALLTTVAFMF